MKLILIVLTCVICFTSAFAQSNVQYASYSTGNKEQVFFDDFNNSLDTLWVASGDTVDYIRDGLFHYFSDTGGHIAADFYVDLDSTKNYEIEFTAQVPNYNQTGIMFWGREGTNGHSNYWYFYKNGNSKFIKCSTLKECSEIRIKGKAHSKFNKYTLRRVDGFYYFYVNEKLRKTAPATPLYGDMFGLGAGTNRNRVAETVFDNIRISYLNR